MGTRAASVVFVVIVALLVVLNLRGSVILHDQDPSILAPYSEDHRQYLTPSQRTLNQFQRKRRNVVLIHVGKTGGETVRHTLKVTCRMRQNPEQKELCHDLFSNHTESKLSQHTKGTLHCDRLFPPDSLDQATTLLWTIRNPVDRIVSWFYYMNPANCYPVEDYYSTACNTNRTIIATTKKNQKGSKWAAKFFGCFASVNTFASSLYSTGTTDSSIDGCSQIAWRTLAGEASISSGHAFYNYAYYWNRTRNSMDGVKEVWVVRTESLWQDMSGVEDIFQRSEHVLQHPLMNHSNITHGSEGHRQRERLSSQNRQHLCCALVYEMDIYRKILQRASNLEEPEKRRTLHSLDQQCRKTCPTTKQPT